MLNIIMCIQLFLLHPPPLSTCYKNPPYPNHKGRAEEE